MNFQDLREQLPPLKDRVYLNTGTSGPVPLDAFHVGEELLGLFLKHGFASPNAIEAYMGALSRARKAIARVVGADPAEIALTQSTSDGIGIVAAGIDWQPGDEVIISDLEHISGIAPWVRLAAAQGVKVVNLKAEGGFLDDRRIKEAITDSTRLVCISHVSYATGAELPVREVCAEAKRHGALVVIDGAQSAGHIPIDVKSIGCDFYALPGQKWLLGHEGTGALYVSQAAIDKLEPTRVGWASLAHEVPGADDVTLHAGARRFESGTVHAPAFATLAASSEILESIGWSRIAERARQLAGLARGELSEIEGVEIITPLKQATGLLTFAVPDVDPGAIVKHLWDRHRVLIRSIPHPKALRASFHAFNNEDDVAKLVEGMRSALSVLRG